MERSHIPGFIPKNASTLHKPSDSTQSKSGLIQSHSSFIPGMNLNKSITASQASVLNLSSTSGSMPMKSSMMYSTFSSFPVQPAKGNDLSFDKIKFSQTGFFTNMKSSGMYKPKREGDTFSLIGSAADKSLGQMQMSKFSGTKQNRKLAKKSFEGNHVPSFIKNSKKEQQETDKNSRKQRNSGRKGSMVKSALMESQQDQICEISTTNQLYGLELDSFIQNISQEEQNVVLSGAEIFSEKDVKSSQELTKQISLPQLIQPLSEGKKVISIEEHTQLGTNLAAIKMSEEQQRKFPCLADFQLGEMLGKGAFGSVRVARHKETGFFIALKTCSLKAVKEKKDRFIECLKLQTWLNHPNVAVLYGFFIERDEVYLMMELCVDIDLSCMAKYLRKKPKETKEVIKGIVRGLQYMHNNQIIHRDIKLENILMCHDMPKITDFDLSVYHQNFSESRRTFCGSPAYFSPEMLENYCYNSKADVWSLGILCYELICGYFPFAMQSYSQAIDSIVKENPKEYPEDLEKDAKGFIQLMLVKNPEARAGWAEILAHPYLTQ